MTNKTIPARKDCPTTEKWHLSDIYATREDWQAARDSIPGQLDDIQSFRGRLKDPQQLLNCLTKQDEMEITLSSVFAWARMMADTDTGNQQYQADAASVMPLLDQTGAATAFIEPELLALPEETLKSLPDALPGLAKYRFRLQELLRMKAHILTPEQEAFLARTGELRSAPRNTYTVMANADLKFPDTLSEDGRLTPLSESRYMNFLRSEKREVRQDAFTKLFQTYHAFRNTFASLYSASVKSSQFTASMRHYETMRAAALDVSNIPLSVYDSAIEATHATLPALHRYMAVKKRLLKLDKVHMYDLYVPVIEKPAAAYTYEQATAILKEALAPLGSTYEHDLFQGLESGWVDRCENQGKRSGAYSWGVYGVHPFVLMSWNDTYESMSTLAHEMGHSMHSWYSSQEQDFVNSEYTIFCAEVASTTNENLLLEYMLQHAKGRDRLYYLNLYLEQIRTTVFRQMLFAEFELLTHAAVEKGEALTADKLESIWMKLNRTYYGEDVVLDTELAAEWSRIPHFYRPFYVYQYATGYAAAMTLSHNLRTKGEPAQKAYLHYLASGGSDYSITLLQRAGVDMTTPEPFQITFQKFTDCLNELETLTE
ncbi:oligoendopeptidase F [uncultured Mitsuokella sp.]|uniref:oligoendopeptidase F n=1 Tax=uncultured Mitsuokella sp. TaxID=453120 RepID=UPI0025986D60|nr:oligoendopeptidase F [uncultured Mitsuokella sp.]